MSGRSNWEHKLMQESTTLSEQQRDRALEEGKQADKFRTVPKPVSDAIGSVLRPKKKDK